MKLSVTRSLGDMVPVLKDASSGGPEIFYWVFSNVSNGEWENLTVLAPGKVGEEFTKTFGHYHLSQDIEKYKVLSGSGVFVLQSPIQNGSVKEVLLVKAFAGDEITVPLGWGHSWSNTGDLPLLTLDNWRSGHSPADYDPQTNFRGMACYITQKGYEKNWQYKLESEPRWALPSDLASLE